MPWIKFVISTASQNKSQMRTNEKVPSNWSQEIHTTGYSSILLELIFSHSSDLRYEEIFQRWSSMTSLLMQTYDIHSAWLSFPCTLVTQGQNWLYTCVSHVFLTPHPEIFSHCYNSLMIPVCSERVNVSSKGWLLLYYYYHFKSWRKPSWITASGVSDPS